MPGIKPSIKLARLHDAFNKHAPTIEVCCIEFKGHTFKQFACSCGHVFWDTDINGTPCELALQPTTEWGRCLQQAYRATARHKAFKAYWRGCRHAHAEGFDQPYRAFWPT